MKEKKVNYNLFEFEKELKVLSFKSFMLHEIKESHKEILKEYNVLINGSMDALATFQTTEDFNLLDERTKKDSKEILRLSKISEDRWSNTSWLKIKKINQRVGTLINSNDKKTLTAYSHLG